MSNPNVFDILEYFDPADVGKALAKNWAINSLSFELVPALDDEGNYAECPLTLTTLKNPAMTKDGCVYQMGAILEWIHEHKLTSPLTGLPLPHSKVMRLKSMIDVVQSFVTACKDRSWAARWSSASRWDQVGTGLRDLRSRLAALEKHLLLQFPQVDLSIVKALFLVGNFL